jgi:hypothetical protein
MSAGTNGIPSPVIVPELGALLPAGELGLLLLLHAAVSARSTEMRGMV